MVKQDFTVNLPQIERGHDDRKLDNALKLPPLHRSSHLERISKCLRCVSLGRWWRPISSKPEEEWRRSFNKTSMSDYPKSKEVTESLTIHSLKERTYSQKLDSRNPATACNVSRLKKAVTTDHFKASREEEVKIEQDLTVNLPQIDRKRWEKASFTTQKTHRLLTESPKQAREIPPTSAC